MADTTFSSKEGMLQGGHTSSHHDFVSTTSTQKIFKTGFKLLDNASLKSWRGTDMYVTQYIYFQMKIRFKFVE